LLLSETLKDILHQEGLSRKDQLLLILGCDIDKPKTILQIKRLASSSGLRAVQKWNVSSTLSSYRGLVIRVDGGWILTAQGREYLRSRNLLQANTPAINNVIVDLRQHLAVIQDPNTRTFLEEAIGCLEANLFRAGVVFSWIGAVALLYDHVIQTHLAAFNAAAKQRDPKWRDAVTSDDLARMKEYDFLDVLEAISVIGKNVKQELQGNCLKLRNACGHPSSLTISQNRAAAHVEVLIQNVFSKL